MKTSIKKLFLLACLGLILVGSAKGQPGNYNGFLWYQFGNAVEIVGYEGPGGAISIPSSINGLPVTSIVNEVDPDYLGVTSVTIPNSVTSIEGGAFASYPGDTSLTAITVEAGNPAYSSANGMLFDLNQTTLIEFPCGIGGTYTIPNSVTSIGPWAFEDCTSLTSVTIPNSVTSIETEAFLECTSLANVCFAGSEPTDGGGIFYGDPVSTIYYVSGTSGWGSTYDGIPTASCAQCAGITSGPFANGQTLTVPGFPNQTTINLTGTAPNNLQLTYTVTMLPNPNNSLFDPQNNNTPITSAGYIIPGMFPSGTGPNVTYSPGPGYTGNDSFQFTVDDGSATSAAATVSITVVGVPTANNQTVTAPYGTATPIMLIGTDPNKPARMLTYTVSLPAYGILQVDGNTLSGAYYDFPDSYASGSGPTTLTYTPNNNFTGQDSFQFTVNNGVVSSPPGTVTINAGCQLVLANSFHQSDGLPNVPTSFGFGSAACMTLPAPAGTDPTTGEALTVWWGCALCSAATMLTSFPQWNDTTPELLNQYFTSSLVPDGYLPNKGNPCQRNSFFNSLSSG